MDSYEGLIVAALLPALMTAVFIILDKHTIFKSFPEGAKQFFYGLFFGIIAILGTEKGIPINGAQVNVRDAAVLTAGLVFGAPAGIIAGLMGGIERYIAVYWGIGTYTRVACSISTIVAGFYSAALRKYMFDNYKPSCLLSFVIGLVMEVFHMTMVFITNMNDATRAMEVVRSCSAVMISANSIATLISVYVAQYLTTGFHRKEAQLSVSQTIQRWLLLCVIAVFGITTVFTYQLQSSIAADQVTRQLKTSVSDLSSDIEDVSGEKLIELAKLVREEIGTKDLNTLAREYGVTEIDLIDSEGIIIDSTYEPYEGFDMHSGEQSREFLCLLDGAEEYVQKYGPIAADENVYRKYAGLPYNDGMIQVAYSAEQFQDDISHQVVAAAGNKHVGSTGYLIVADSRLNIISAPAEHCHSTIEEYGFDSKEEADTLISCKVDGEDAVALYTETEGYYIVAVIPATEAYQIRNVAMYANTFMEILAFAALFAMIFFLIKRVIVNKIDDVNKSLSKITAGDLDEVVNVNSNHEFVLLSKDINQTVGKLKEYIAEANARIDSEIEYAKNIQENALPHIFPNDNKYEIFALMEAAKGVGGDFYDFYKTTRHGVNFMIADVSGKGIPGAMFMMRAKAELHSLTETGIPVNDVFTYGNERLCEGNAASMFVTAWEGNINLETGLVQFANAGHNPPVIMRTDGTCEYIKGKAGFVLAAMDGIQYKLQELQMNEGDILFLYTDGVVEATNLNNELYGEDRLINCLRNVDTQYGMEYLLCEVIGDVGRFVGEAEQFDDITMLALRYKGNYPNNHEENKNSYDLGGKNNI